MPARRILTATLPDGQVAKRTTARVYSHVIAKHWPAGAYRLANGEERQMPDRWHVICWAGRPELALKQAARYEAQAIPVDG